MPLNKIKIDMALVFSAGVLWSTVGIGVRLIETPMYGKFALPFDELPPRC